MQGTELLKLSHADLALHAVEGWNLANERTRQWKEAEDERDRLLLQVDVLKKIITRLRHHVSTDNICDCPAHMEGQPHRDGCLLMAVAEVTGETPKTEKRNDVTPPPPCVERDLGASLPGGAPPANLRAAVCKCTDAFNRNGVCVRCGWPMR